MRINCTADGELHHHDTFEQLAACARGRDMVVMVSDTPAAPKAARSGPVTPVSGAPAMRHPTAAPTGPQLTYIDSLGGSWRDSHGETRAEASQLIETLKDPELREMFMLPTSAVPLDDPEWDSFPKERKWRRGQLPSEWASFDEGTGKLNGPSSTFTPDPPDPWRVEPYRPVDKVAPLPTAAAKPVRSSPMPRLDAMKPMLDRIPDGYFGVELDEGLRFMRVSRPKKGRMAGALQIQICSGGNNYDGMMLWPSGRWSVYDMGKTFDIEAHVLHLLVDHKRAARTYAKKINRCARCNTRLTDARSRHYGIGPECEKHWPTYISEIDLDEAEEKGF